MGDEALWCLRDFREGNIRRCLRPLGGGVESVNQDSIPVDHRTRVVEDENFGRFGQHAAV